MASRFLFSSSVLLVLTALTGQSQTVPASPPSAAPAQVEVPTPKDARERLELAKKVNGLLPMVNPWHLKARYEIFAEDGTSMETGTYEEWRSSATQYRIALHGPSVSVEEYGTDHGVFRTGQSSWPLKPLSAIRGMVERPVAAPAHPEKIELKNFERSFGSSKLPCTALLMRGMSGHEKDAEYYCFGETNAALVYATTPDQELQTLFQGIVLVNGHHLAKELQLFLGGRIWMKVNVDTITSLPKEELAALTVPADATLVAARTSTPGDATGGKLIQKVVPAYPSKAKMQGIEGIVVLNGIIGTDGHFKELQVLAGPQMLQQPALDAVRQWVYSPYVLDGQPIEIETEIHVVFKVGS
jgi:TonB family protein